MKSYLLDTHTALWYFSGDGELPEAAREAMVDVHNNVFISMLSLWEIAIKLSLKKLSLPRPFAELETSIVQEGFQLLPLRFEELKIVESLPFHHRDPFDRLLIAQALVYDLPIISRDTIFDLYAVQRYWHSFTG